MPDRGSMNHLRLTVADIPAARAFYEPLLTFLGYRLLEADQDRLAWAMPGPAGNRQWVILSGAAPELAQHRHDRLAPGLHHFAFNVESRAAVHACHELLQRTGAEILDAPAPYEYEPGYFAVFFRDPNGFKLEVVHVPRTLPPAGGMVDPSVTAALLRNALALRAGERAVVIADTTTCRIGEALLDGALLAGANAALLVTAPSGADGAEPTPLVSDTMASADAVVCATRHSLTHTEARRRSTAAGARLASLPGIDDALLTGGAITADLDQISRRTEALKALLTGARSAVIRSAGAELTMSLAGRAGHGSTGRFHAPGSFGNLPTGEAYIAPVEGSANGELVVDGSIAGVGRVETPTRLRIENGQLIDATGPTGERLLELLGASPPSRGLAELGIGTNHEARVTGTILEDEKALGTLHIAFGDNTGFGGTLRANVHVDAVLLCPELVVDGVTVLCAGRLLIEPPV